MKKIRSYFSCIILFNGSYWFLIKVLLNECLVISASIRLTYTYERTIGHSLWSSAAAGLYGPTFVAPEPEQDQVLSLFKLNLITECNKKLMDFVVAVGRFGDNF